MVGADCRNPSSSSSIRVQINCDAAIDPAMYSASMLDIDTEGCLRDVQETRPPAIITTYPDMDLRSVRLVPQSASE